MVRYSYSSYISGFSLIFLHECGSWPMKFTFKSYILETPTNNDYGAPHALEHLVFFGSKRNPYRGYLDEFAVNHFCSEINATTKTDHTW